MLRNGATMAIQTIQASPWGQRLLYFSMSGLALSLVVAHAQYGEKVGQVIVVFLIPFVLAFLLAFACGIVQKLVERSIRAKHLMSAKNKKKGASSRYMFGSAATEVRVKTLVFTIGGFLGLYFLMALILIAVLPLWSFIISADFAGIFMLVFPAYLDGRQIVRKR
jgi:hypothetical protein